jgi:hypothetical protein
MSSNKSYDLGWAISKGTSMAQTQKGLKDTSASQHNKMNENKTFGTLNLHKLLKRCWKKGLSGPVTVWTWKIGLAPKTPLIV